MYVYCTDVQPNHWWGSDVQHSFMMLTLSHTLLATFGKSSGACALVFTHKISTVPDSEIPLEALVVIHNCTTILKVHPWTKLCAD